MSKVAIPEFGKVKSFRYGVLAVFISPLIRGFLASSLILIMALQRISLTVYDIFNVILAFPIFCICLYPLNFSFGFPGFRLLARANLARLDCFIVLGLGWIYERFCN